MDKEFPPGRYGYLYKKNFGITVLCVILILLGLFWLHGTFNLTPSGIRNGFVALFRGGIPTYSETRMQEYEADLHESLCQDTGSCRAGFLITAAVDDRCDQFYYIIRQSDCSGHTLFLHQDDVQIGFMQNLPVPAIQFGDPGDPPQTRLSIALHDTLRFCSYLSKITQEDALPACDQAHAGMENQLRNASVVELSEDAVEALLAEHAENSAYPVVIVVEDMADVFEKAVPNTSYLILAVFAASAIGLVVLAAVQIRKRNRS